MSETNREVRVGDVWSAYDKVLYTVVSIGRHESSFMAHLSDTSTILLTPLLTPRGPGWTLVSRVSVADPLQPLHNYAGGRTEHRAEVPLRDGDVLVHKVSGRRAILHEIKGLSRSHWTVTLEGGSLPHVYGSLASVAMNYTLTVPHETVDAGLYPHQVEGARQLREQFQARLSEVRQGDPRLQEVLASKQRLVAEVTWHSRVPSDNRALFSSFIPRGPRWTRDGFDRCQGPGHAKWLRFLGSAYERCRLDRRVLPAGYRLNPHLTEAECDAHLAHLADLQSSYVACHEEDCTICAALFDVVHQPQPPRRDPPDLVHWSEARERARAARGRS